PGHAAERAGAGAGPDVGVGVGGEGRHPGLVTQHRAAGALAAGIDREDTEAVAGRGQLAPERLDEGRLPDARQPRDADAHGRAGRGLESREELPGPRTVLGAGRLHERDRAAHRGAVALADTVHERVGTRHRWPSCSRSRARGSRAERAITVPGRKTAAAPISSRVVTSLGGMTPPITIMMSSRPWSARARLSAGSRVR